MPTMYPPFDGAQLQGPPGAIYRAAASVGTNVATSDQGAAIAQGWTFAPPKTQTVQGPFTWAGSTTTNVPGPSAALSYESGPSIFTLTALAGVTNAVVRIEGSADGGVTWNTLGTIQAVSAGSGGLAVASPWPQVRANVISIAGGSVSVAVSGGVVAGALPAGWVAGVNPGAAGVPSGYVSLSAWDTSAAAANTAAIQAALNQGGLVQIITPGVCYINASLIYGDNTTLKVSPLCALTNINPTGMLKSQGQQAYLAGGAAVTLAWTAGTSVQVTWTNHGLSQSQAVYLWGVTPSVFKGVFVIDSVVDANNFKITLPKTPPSAPTGSALAVKATQNFILDGGLWDWGPGAANSVDCHVISLGIVENCHVLKGTRVTRAAKYCAVTVGALNCSVQIDAELSNGDGVKVYGPSRNVRVLGVTGTYTDDVCSVHTYEGVGYQQYQLTDGGDIYAARIEGINAFTLGAASLFAVYASSDAYYIDRVDVDGVYGNSAGSYAVKTYGVDAGALVGSLFLRNIGGQGGSAAGLFCSGGVIDLLVVDKFAINPTTSSTTGLLVVNTGTTVSTIEITDPYLVDSALGWISASAAPAIALDGTTDLVVLRGGKFNSALSYTGSMFSLGAGATKNVVVDGMQLPSGSAAVIVSPGLGVAPNIVFSNNNFDGCNALVNVNGPCTIALKGNRINNANLGIARFNATAAVTISSDGTNQWSGTTVAFSVGSGTPTLTVKGFDIPVAPNTAGVARTAGSYCFNNAAGVGTLVQNNLVVCDATGAAGSWKQLTNTANSY